MAPYVSLIILILFEWMLFFPGGKVKFGIEVSYNQKRKFMILACVELILFASIRALDVGIDLTSYLGALKYYKSLPHDQILGAKLVYPYDFEVGYFWLTKICAWLSMSDSFFFAVLAALIYVPVCWFISRNSENPEIGILVYFAFSIFSYSFGIYRQMIALSILLVGSKFIEERKLLKFLLVVGFAMTFHSTAAIMLPFYWIYKTKIYNKIWLIVLAEIICFIGARAIVMLAVKIMPMYAKYVSSVYDTQGGSYLMLLLLNLIYIAGYRLAQKEYMADDLKFQMSLNATVVAIFLQIVGYAMGIIGRAVPYYSIYLTILIPSLINGLFRKNVLMVRFISVCILIVMFCFLTSGSRLDPYTTIWSK